ncbi:MAG TPA: hypothetical protein VGB76_02525 [Pyrinomonadaceae bacterium]|jgi:hypothetical protein
MNHKIKYLALPLCLILLTTPACNRDGIGASSGGATLPGSGVNNSGGTTTSAAISETDKPLDVMTRAMRAQLDAKSYRAHVTTTLADNAPNKMIIEYVAPDRYRMVNDMQVGGKSVSQEFIIVGNGSYIKAPNGQWMRSPVDASEIVKGFRDPKMLDELAKTADVKFVGADVIGGAPMLVYQYTQNNPMGMQLKSVSKTWLSVADGLPRKTESEGEFQGKKTKTLVSISDYNADIKIESPIK